MSITLIVDQTTGAFISPAGVIAGNALALTTGTLAQFAATTSLQLKTLISDETGSGALVFATSPTLVTPDLGVATATSITGAGLGIAASGANSIIFSTNGTAHWTITSGGNLNNSNSESIRVGGVFTSASNGSAASPTYAWSGETTMGMYRVGSAEVGFATNSVQKFGADTTGFYFGATAGKLRWSHTDSNVDQIIFWDDSAGGYVGLSLTGLTISGTTLTVDAATTSAAGVGELATSAETLGGQSTALLVTPSGLGAYNLGTQLTTVGNVGAGEDDLCSFTIPANTLSVNGQSIRVRATGQIASGQTGVVKIYFGATSISSGSLAGPERWAFDAIILRTGAATQRIFVLQTFPDNGVTQNGYTTAAETLSGSVTLKITGESTIAPVNNDVTLNLAKATFEQ
jgi:hypothetical protein